MMGFTGLIFRGRCPLAGDDRQHTVIAGSTRMKGGLAQKMVLNLLSTTVMVRLGHVDGNLMTHMVPSSEKLRERGLRIVMSLGDLDRAAAAALLAECEGNVAEATRVLHAKGSRAQVR